MFENVVADHLSCFGPEATPTEKVPIDDSFPNDKLVAISSQAILWYANLVNYKVCGVLPLGLSYK